MEMVFYKNPVNNEVFGFDASDESQQQYISDAINAGFVNITGSWPLPPTDEQKKEVCIVNAKSLIAAVDWAVLPDVGLANVSDFTAYRATLRQLILNPVADPVWPTEPTPVWS